MRVLLTHAGRHGDALWALATARAVAETVEADVDFLLPAKYGGLSELIQTQPYVGVCYVDPEWDVVETAPISPAEPPELEGRMIEREVMPRVPPLEKSGYDKIVHLSFRGWPESRTLAEGYWENVQREYFPELLPLELERPWIWVAATGPGSVKSLPGAICSAWSDEHFELKLGVLTLMDESFHVVTCAAPGSRWVTEAGYRGTTWFQMAQVMRSSEIFLGCLSAGWVLANAMGKLCVIMEPAEQRHHPVFWLDSPRNVLVRGVDGKPTFDARHVTDALKEALGRKPGPKKAWETDEDRGRGTKRGKA